MSPPQPPPKEANVSDEVRHGSACELSTRMTGDMVLREPGITENDGPFTVCAFPMLIFLIFSSLSTDFYSGQDQFQALAGSDCFGLHVDQRSGSAVLVWYASLFHFLYRRSLPLSAV